MSSHESTRHRISIVAGVSVLALLGLGVANYFTPQYTLYQMRKAAQNQDAESLGEFIDYPTLREDLRGQFKAVLFKSMATEKDNPFAGLGMMIAGQMIDPMVDAFISPAGLQTLFANQTQSAEKSAEPTSDTQSSENQVKPQYIDFNHFQLESVKDNGKIKEIVPLIFERKGLWHWQLTKVQLPADMMNETKSGQSSSQSVSTGWRVEQESNAMDDSKEIYAHRESEEPISGEFGENVRPSLIVRCTHNKPEIFVQVGARLIDYGSSQETISGRLRIDSATASDFTAPLSTDSKAFFLANGDDAVAQVKTLQYRQKLAVEYDTSERKGLISVFNLDGLLSVLQPYKAACGL